MAEERLQDERDHLEENKPFEDFKSLTKKLLSVPKEEVDEKRREEKREERAG